MVLRMFRPHRAPSLFIFLEYFVKVKILVFCLLGYIYLLQC